ncbi:hypothetical protein OIU84_029220 [Salix udensis]|uniref:Uncharacterized protein n=1 Tax=Salix udensis TaxID=889485 RepID=A0AAD6P7Z6_9ROSI|nr:hypothetical protein OIU84_029220 [Salix udensis]
MEILYRPMLVGMELPRPTSKATFSFLRLGLDGDTRIYSFNKEFCWGFVLSAGQLQQEKTSRCWIAYDLTASAAVANSTPLGWCVERFNSGHSGFWFGQVF